MRTLATIALFAAFTAGIAQKGNQLPPPWGVCNASNNWCNIFGAYPKPLSQPLELVVLAGGR